MHSPRGHVNWVLGLLVLAHVGGCKGEEKKDSDDHYEPPPREATTTDEYADLCRDAKNAFPGAPKYDKKKAAGELSKAVVFRKYNDDEKGTYSALSPERLKGFLAEGPKVTELVVCVDLKKIKFNAQCTYYGGKVELFDMKTKIRILEAATGKELAAEEADLGASAMRCWGSYSFPNGQSNIYEGPDVSQKILAMLQPLEPEGAALPEAQTAELTSVCDGLPFPQAGKYDPAKKEKRAVHVAYRTIAAYPYDRDDLPDGLPPKADPPPALKDVQLVACATGQSKKKVRDCNFSGGTVLELHDGEVEVLLREARTGKVVETKKFKASAGQCPFSYKFFGTRDTWFGKIEPAFAAWIKSLSGG